MSLGLTLLAGFWRHRAELLVPTVLLPLIFGGYALSQPPAYTATALLQVDAQRVQSPLLQNLTDKEQEATLNRILHGEHLLRDTGRDAGVHVSSKAVRLRVVNGNLIEIAYTAPQEGGLENLVDALATNFIYEVLAPERLRAEQRLATLGAQLKDLRHQPASTDPRYALELQTLTAQYAAQMDVMGAINAAFTQSGPGGLIWFAEPARMHEASLPATRAWHMARYGALVGLAFGFLLVVFRRMRPRGVASADLLTHLTQLPLAGTLPDIGAVQIVGGDAVVVVGQTSLNPVGFTEVARLHRALTRSLHGALVFTSASEGEGTTLLATLLALKSAATGKRTLLVDLNLKNGRLTQAFDLETRAWGLAATSAKRKAASMSAEAIAEGAGAHGLDILPLPSDVETLAHLQSPEGAAAFLDGLSSTYEHVFVDTTPLAAHNRHNADPVMLAAAAPRTALVAMMRRTPPHLLRRAAEQLFGSGANVTGVVANNLHNPSPKALLMHMAATMARFTPGLANWLRGKVSGSGIG